LNIYNGKNLESADRNEINSISNYSKSFNSNPNNHTNSYINSTATRTFVTGALYDPNDSEEDEKDESIFKEMFKDVMVRIYFNFLLFFENNFR
jgi:hypothetical protein